MNGAIGIDLVNAMSREDFLLRFGDVAEHTPWVAALAELERPFDSRDDLVDAFVGAIRIAPDAEKLDLIRAHPDLAGKAAIAGTIADASKREQAGAGLAHLSESEYQRFTTLNTLYRRRFGFPFIFAVKGATKDQILAEFERRVKNDPAVELEMALAQIGRIFRFRLEDLVRP